jgi:peroxiredoxin Q/BCP
MLGASAAEPLAVGAVAPGFDLESTGGGRASLSALLAKGPVALYFYPGDFTPG